MESHSRDINGIRMRWEEAGAGQPVILLHGIPTCPGLWRKVVPRLDDVRALAWELVGYGASIDAGIGRDISVARQATYLKQWMDAMGIDRAVLVGHDLGGGIAQILAVREPERVQGLVLMNAISYDAWPIPLARMLRLMGPLVKRLPPRAIRFIIASLLLLGHDDWACMKESLAVHWPNYAREDGPDALVRQLRSLDVRDTLSIADRLPMLIVPTRLVWGAAGRFQTIGYGYRLAHDLHGRLDRIEGGHHFVPEDHAEAVAKTINRLVAEVAIGRPTQEEQQVAP